MVDGEGRSVLLVVSLCDVCSRKTVVNLSATLYTAA